MAPWISEHVTFSISLKVFDKSSALVLSPSKISLFSFSNLLTVASDSTPFLGGSTRRSVVTWPIVLEQSSTDLSL
jgi:hypothetical protein